jgi:uncharacterized membrane protein YbhN (UPF0104 family)
MDSKLYRFLKNLLAPDVSGKNREKYLFAGKILFSVGLIFYLYNRIEFSKLHDTFTSADISLLAIVVIMGFLNIYLQYCKWKILCVACLRETSNKRIFLSLIQGLAAGAFTPARIGEYVGRKFSLPNQSLFDVTITTAVDKFFLLFLNLAAGSIAVILFLHYALLVNLYITSSLFILIAFGLLLSGYFLLHEQLWDSILVQYLRQFKFLQGIAHKFTFLRQLDNKTLLRAMIVNIIFYICFLLQFAILIVAFHLQTNIITAVWIGSLMFFTKSLFPAISVGDIGIREMISVYFVSQFGIPEAVGFNAAFMIFIINIALPAIVGMILYFVKPDVS